MALGSARTTRVRTPATGRLASRATQLHAAQRSLLLTQRIRSLAASVLHPRGRSTRRAASRPSAALAHAAAALPPLAGQLAARHCLRRRACATLVRCLSLPAEHPPYEPTFASAAPPSPHRPSPPPAVAVRRRPRPQAGPAPATAAVPASLRSTTSRTTPIRSLVWLHDAGGDERRARSGSCRWSACGTMSRWACAAPAAAERRGFGWPQTADGILAAESADCRSRRPGPAAIQRSSAAAFFWPATSRAARWRCASPFATRALCRRRFDRRLLSRRAFAAGPLAAGSPLALLIVALPRFADLSGRPGLPGAVAVSRRRHVA